MAFHTVFIDLTKEFDTVIVEALWVMLSKLGCKLIPIIHLMHNNIVEVVPFNCQQSDPFGILSGVRQGCILTGVFFHPGGIEFKKGLNRGGIYICY